MKISVDFPSVAYREGPAKVAELARAIETIGYDDLAVFDHVIMGYETDTRAAPIYPSQMPILEALVTLAFAAAVTDGSPGSPRCWFPQRQAVLSPNRHRASTPFPVDVCGPALVWRAGSGVRHARRRLSRRASTWTMIPLMRLLGRGAMNRAAPALPTRHRHGAEAAPRPHLPIWFGRWSCPLRRIGEWGDGWTLGRQRRPGSRRHREITATPKRPRDPWRSASKRCSLPPRSPGGKALPDHDRGRAGRADRTWPADRRTPPPSSGAGARSATRSWSSSPAAHRQAAAVG
jgi:hypothetical protein